MRKIIKRIDVTAIFPGGRVVRGVTRYPPEFTDRPFQIWFEDGGAGSVIINPQLAETVETKVEYEE